MEMVAATSSFATRTASLNGFTIQTDQTVGTGSQDFTLAAHHYVLI